MALNEKVNIEIESKAKGDGFKRVNKELNETSKSLDSAKVSLAKFGVVAGGLAIAGITKFLSHSITLGKELKILRDNFEGTSKDIDLFRKATAGTVSEGSLIKLSNYASDLGVSLKDQALLFSLAEDAADKYGGGVEANFERVISATDGSAKGLRSVGIAVKDYNKELESLTKQQGINIDNLEADEQLQIRLQAIYNLTGVSIEGVNSKLQDEADIFDSLSIAIDDAMSRLGEGFIQGLELSGEKAKEMNVVLEGLKTLFYDIGKGLGSFVSATAKELESIADIVDWIGKKYQEVRDFQDQNPWVKKINDAILGESQTDKSFSNIDRPFRESDFKMQRPVETETDKKFVPIRTSKPSGNTEAKIKEDKEAIAKALLESIKVEILKGVTMPGTLPSVSIRETLRDDYFGNMTQQEIQTMSNEGGFSQTIQTLDYGELNQEAMNLNTNITNILSTLGVGTDNFINKMFTGFNNILSLIQNFIQVANAVSGIVGIFKAVGTVATGGVARLRTNSGTSGTNAYFRIDLNAMNIVREGNSQLDKYNNAIRVSI